MVCFGPIGGSGYFPRDNTNVSRPDVPQKMKKSHSKYNGYYDRLNSVTSWEVDKQSGAKVGKDKNGNIIMKKFEYDNGGSMVHFASPGQSRLTSQAWTTLYDDNGNGKFEKMDIHQGSDVSGRYVSTKDNGVFDKIKARWSGSKSDQELLNEANNGKFRNLDINT
jgi:hypothetical protein